MCNPSLLLRFPGSTRPLATTKHSPHRRWRAGLATAIVFAASWVTAQAQQVVTLPASGGVAPANIFSGTNYSGVHTNGFSFSTSGGTDSIDLQVTNLPVGVTASVSPSTFTPSSSTAVTVGCWIRIVVTSVAAGDYTLYIVASSTNTGITPRVKTFNLNVGNRIFWNGVNAGSVAWTTAANWAPQPAGVPNSGADVYFDNLGFVTNNTTASGTVGRLSYIAAGASTGWRTSISGTLTVTNGFSANNMRSVDGGGNGSSTGFILTGGGLVVTNPLKDFALNAYNNAAASPTFTYNLSGLTSLKAYVNRFGAADLSLITEGTIGPQNFRLSLPATTIVASYADPSGYTADHFLPSIQFFSHDDNTTYQNGQPMTGSCGAATFWADSFVVGGARVNGSANTFSMSGVTQLRNTDGASRMSMFGVGVDSGNNTIGSGSKFTLVLPSADVKADKLWLGRCRPRQGANANAHIQGYIMLSGGTVDVNTAVLGYQIATNDNDCRGVITNTGGTLVVNNLLTLGYTVGDFVTNGSFANVSLGLLSMSGASAIAKLNSVACGGPANLSTSNNNIVLTSSASLILSNTIGSATAKLNLLSMSGSSLTLHPNGTGTRIYARNLVSSGTCSINFGGITNTGAYPAQIPLISYETATAAFTLGTFPSASPAYGGYLVTNVGNSSIDLALTNGPYQPGAVTWTGLNTGDWDTATTNWLNGATPYRFSDGVPVRFDDSGLTGSVNLTGSRAPSSTTVSNNNFTYTFSGPGKVTGNGSLTKQGGSALILDNSGSNDFSGPITISGGTIQLGISDSNGNPGGGNITNNGALVFNRSDNPVLANNIYGTGSLTQNGAGKVTLTGSDTSTGATVVNAGILALTGSTALSSSASIAIAAGAALDVSGRTDGTLTLTSGQVLQGNGIVRGSVVASSGSSLMPGASPGILTVTNNVVLLGTTTLEIDKAAGTNDLLRASAAMTYGGTLVVSILTTQLADGNSFKLFDASSYSGVFATIVPSIPGAGLGWDTNSLTANGTLKVVSTIPPGLLTWSGATDTNWDLATTNWLNLSSNAVAYSDGLPVRFSDSGSNSAVNLTTSLSPNLTIVDNSTVPYTLRGTGKLSETGALLKLNSGTLTLANTGTNTLSGGTTISGGTLQVGDGGPDGSLGLGDVTNNATLAFNRPDGVTVNNAISGSGSLVQNGSGSVSLTANNTYSGSTIVSAGTLALAGSAAISSSTNITLGEGAALDVSGRGDDTLTLSSGQTLRGNGSVLGSLSAGPGSIVMPGTSLGNLTVTNAATLQGTAVMEIDKTAGTNDLLGGAASLTYGGTLVVSNLTAALTNGDSFKLFDANAYSGAFTNIVPKRPGPGLAWDTTALTDSGSLGVALAPSVVPTPSLKVDFSIAGRAEAIDPNYSSWVINDAVSISSNFNGITITLTKTGAYGVGLTGDWWKSGVDDFHCLMADDGVTVNSGNLGGQIQMTISGLSEGAHTIATYHNTWQDPSSHTFAPMNIYVNGVLTFADFVPSNRVTNNYDAASAFITVNVQEDQDVVILYQSDTNFAATDKNVWISGLEIDTVASTLKAINPIPVNADEHVDVDSGTLNLIWQGAQAAVSHDVYFGTSSNAVSIATHASPEFKGNQAGTAYAVSGLNSLLTYYWRVDEVNATNGVAKGDTWYFRKRHLAFPGAEGYGRFARGGRGGVVLEVTNLADDGPGTLRWAVSQTLADNGPRTVVFAVSGLIELQSEINIGSAQSKLTIAGQTAPGKGINMKKLPMGCAGGSDLIIRHIRVFPGKYSGQTVNGLGFGGVNHSIMDHCSSGWSMDECIPSRGAQNMTIQHVMISEPLNVAGHKNYPPGTRHGYSSSTSGNIGSWHHDLLANAEGRNWSLAGGLTGDGKFAGNLDIRCNVIYNFNGRTTDGGVAELNFVNNYYKKGPVGGINTYLNPDHGTNADGSYGQRYYSSGNTMPGYPQSNTGGWMTNQPFFPSYVTTESATNAYKIVLSDVGCTQPMVDDHDTRQINEAIYGTNTYFGSVSGLAGLPDSETDVGGWENYPEIHRDANWDSDHDGLPDWWESMRGLNPNSPPGDFSDANADLVGDEYTELDRYLNWMAQPHYDCAYNSTLDVDLSQYTKGFTLSPVRSASNPTNGTVLMLGDGKTARFTPTAGFSGLASFTFAVTDAQGDSMTNRDIGIHVVAPSNTAPTLAPVANKTVNVGVTVLVTNTASDTDVPAQTLTFSLASAPLNATINSNSGVFSWRPQVSQANSVNPVQVVVTDNGSPNLSATQAFNITVNPLTQTSITSRGVVGGLFSLSVNGQTGPDYAVLSSTNLVDWSTLTISNSPPMPFIWTDTNGAGDPTRFYRIKTGPPFP